MITETHYIMENMHVLVGLHASTILKHFLEQLTQGGGGTTKNNNKPQPLTAPL